MIRLRNLLPVLFLLPVLEGCQVPLRSYRLQHPAITVPTAPATGQTPMSAGTGEEKDCVDPSAPICLAFIEVDDMGELFKKGELDTALSVIRRANDDARGNPGHSDPVVITFVHGWKNNAAEDNANVAGFKVALQDIYSRLGNSKKVIGIYIGWRGNLISRYWPVAQQLSYYNREATATRIPGATLSSALTEIAVRTHENSRSLAIFIGHSFGGLLLERAVSEAAASQIAQATIYAQEAGALPAGSEEASQKLALASALTDERADLVIFINPAGAATEAKQMLDFLADYGYRYQPGISRAVPSSQSPVSDRNADRPLFVSLTSTADLATKLAVPIGHAVPVLQFKMAGSFRDLSQNPNGGYELSCFDPHAEPPYRELKTQQEGALPQSSYYLSTAPHMPVLQSHEMLKAIGASQMQVASTGEKITIHNPKAIAECDRNLFNQEGLNVVSTFRLADTQACFAVAERPNRCNGSPYWLMEIDPDVVPDHSTIFTERFIQFMIDTFFKPGGEPMQRIGPRLIQTR
ncbi:MAG TPA: hypothetical protein VGF88_13780 [Acidobacteriaceae bacterium]|jgi:hypothetical protein